MRLCPSAACRADPRRLRVKDASKVKCDGKAPCERCHKRGTECFYKPRQTRKHPISPQTEAPPPKKFEDAAGGSENAPLLPFQKTSLKAFFALYKNYAAPCMRFFISRQLIKMQSHFKTTGNFVYQKLLDEWLSKLDVDLECVKDKHTGCLKHISNQQSWMHDVYVTSAHSHFHCDRTSFAAASLGSWELGLMPTADHAVVDDATPRMRFCGSTGVTANKAFESTFGVTAAELTEALAWTGGEGLLPWAGDVFCRLGMSAEEVVTYVSVTAIKVGSAPHPGSLPSTRSTPAVNVFQLNARPGRRPFLVKSSLTEHMSKAGVAIDLFASFEALAVVAPTPDLDHGSAADSTSSKPDDTTEAGDDDFFVLDFPAEAEDTGFMADLLDWASLVPEGGPLAS